MARKKKHEEHENHERWLVSYADFITLLFAFFVVMYSISAVNEGKFRVLSDSLIAAFRASPRSPQPLHFSDPIKSPNARQPDNSSMPAHSPFGAPVMLPSMPQSSVQQAIEAAKARQETERARAIAEMAEEIEKALAPLIDKQLVTVRRTRSWMEVEIKTSILFTSGSAQLTPAANASIEKVASILGRYPNPIHVEGFTDNRPIRTPAFPSNWELSAARAASVVHLMARSGINPARMAAIGYGEHQPAADNDTLEGRNANRRVVLVVLADPSARRMHEQAREPEAADSAVLDPNAPPPAQAPRADAARS
ncbi:MAG: flagellar motor protein MotD [Gammaproteobacteria bacterium]|nr:flagellar motor protein MotD [Gammaproteobacteria bacterium]